VRSVRLEAQNLALEIRHASQVVGMAESPSQALRRKRDSSLRVARARQAMVKPPPSSRPATPGRDGHRDVRHRVLPAVDRPGGSRRSLPNLRKFTILIDAGANVDPKP